MFTSSLNKNILRNAATLLSLVALAFTPTSVFAFDPVAGDFSKSNPDDVRVFCWNVHNSFIYDSTTDGNYRRIFQAVKPDVIAFQELDVSLTAGQIAARLESILPGTTWNVYLGKKDGNKAGVSNRNVICSVYPLGRKRNDTSPTSNLRGVTIAMVNLPNAIFPRNLYLMNVHFKAGNTADDYRRKQVHADAIINWMRDARTPGGEIDLPSDNPMMLVGDTNLDNAGDLAPYHPRKTLTDGTIYNHTKFGPSSPPDWDGSDNAEAAPYDYNTGDPWTHSTKNPKGRIDRFYYTDSVIHATSRFILNPRTMTDAALAASGIHKNDASGASDHLPLVVDFAPGPDPNPPPQLLINEYCANDLGTDDMSFVELINVGGQEVNLNAPIDYHLKIAQQLPANVPSGENEQASIDLNGVVPPDGGLFVLFDGAGESSGIRAQITNRLPKLQRQNVGSFYMDNDNNSAIALVQQSMSRRNVTSEMLVEAYGYAAPNPGTTRYFRTDSGNNLLVELGAAQWTNRNAGKKGWDTSFSRNLGNVTMNDYAGWTMNAPLTHGLQNAPASSVGDWTLY